MLKNDWQKMLSGVWNDQIEFATMRPPGSPFTTLERRVIMTGPDEIIQLAKTGERRVVAELIELLKEPDRAWAALVMLSAMTGRQGKVVDMYSTTPDEWWRISGATAYENWNAWLEEVWDGLQWDPENSVFTLE